MGAHEGAQGAHVGTPPQRPRLTFREASEATGTPRTTLQRMRESGAFPQAEKDSRGVWRIPVDDLLAAGLSLAKSATGGAHEGAQVVPTGAQMGAHEGAQGAHVGTPRDLAREAELDALELRVEVEKERGLRLAAEREVQAITAHLATAQNTIRMIEAAPPKVERVEVPVVERVEVPVPVAPRWVWPTVVAAVVVALLAAVLTGWALTRGSNIPSSAPSPATPDNTPTLTVPIATPPTS